MRDYDLISLEALKIKNMTKSAKGTKDKPGKNVKAKSGLNRSILEQGWGLFCQRLTDKATNAVTPVEIIAINPAYTSPHTRACVVLSVVTRTRRIARVKLSSAAYRVAIRIKQT